MIIIRYYAGVRVNSSDLARTVYHHFYMPKSRKSNCIEGILINWTDKMQPAYRYCGLFPFPSPCLRVVGALITKRTSSFTFEAGPKEEPQRATLLSTYSSSKQVSGGKQGSSGIILTKLKETIENWNLQPQANSQVSHRTLKCGSVSLS